jgi:hypothetical protein
LLIPLLSAGLAVTDTPLTGFVEATVRLDGTSTDGPAVSVTDNGLVPAANGEPGTAVSVPVVKLIVYADMASEPFGVYANIPEVSTDSG